MKLRDLAFLALGALIAIFAQGLAAPELQLEAGQCRYANIGDGTFQQSDLHTDNYLRPGCGGVAVAGKWAGSERFGYRVAFLAGGEIRARDNVSTNDERAHHHAPCAPPSEDGCMLRFNGEGSSHGIVFAATAEQPLASHLSVIGEAGLYFFAHHFKAEARFTDCPSCGRSISFNESSKLWDAPSPMAGVTLRYRDFFIAARHYWPSGHRAQSLTDFSFTQLSVGIAIPFGGKP